MDEGDIDCIQISWSDRQVSESKHEDRWTESS